MKITVYTCHIKTCLKRRQNSLHHWQKKRKLANSWRQYLPNVVKISANTINRILRSSPKRAISITTMLWKISSTRTTAVERSLSTLYDSLAAAAPCLQSAVARPYSSAQRPARYSSYQIAQQTNTREIMQPRTIATESSIHWVITSSTRWRNYRRQVEIGL